MMGEVLFDQGNHKEAIRTYYKVIYGYGDTKSPAPFQSGKPTPRSRRPAASRCGKASTRPRSCTTNCSPGILIVTKRRRPSSDWRRSPVDARISPPPHSSLPLPTTANSVRLSVCIKRLLLALPCFNLALESRQVPFQPMAKLRSVGPACKPDGFANRFALCNVRVISQGSRGIPINRCRQRRISP